MVQVLVVLLLVVVDLVQAGGQAAGHPAGGDLHVPSCPDGSVQRGVHRAPPVSGHQAPRASRRLLALTFDLQRRARVQQERRRAQAEEEGRREEEEEEEKN